MKFIISGVLAATILLASPCLSQTDLREEAFEYPVLKEPLRIILPHELWHLSHSFGTGYLRLRIGTDGTVEDWIPLELPHYKLIDPLEWALSSAKFTPAILDGEPITADITASIPLSGLGYYGIVTETVAEHIETRIATISPAANRVMVSSPGELDQPLELLSSGEGYQVVDENGNFLSGTVVVEFFIDTQGVPRMLNAREDADPDLSQAAVMTVSEFRFKPPRRKGRPTIVKARIPVIISGQS